MYFCIVTEPTKMYTFTDNRAGSRRRVIEVDAAQLAAHLSQDPQFMFYWLKGWNAPQAAHRSLLMYPPFSAATLPPSFDSASFQPVDDALRARHT